MDANIVAALAPSDPSDSNYVSIPQLPFVRDGHGRLAALRDEVRLLVAGRETRLTFRPLRQLFVEQTVVGFCDADGGDATDQEMEQIFGELRRRPDTAGGALRSYLRATAQLYLSLRDVSAAQYEAAMGRLAKSARTFSEAPISRNYLATRRET
jgi:hypothetical protein